MKALSMKQPVPELILEKKKTIELRTWKTNFKGEFLLHASNNHIMRLMDKFEFEKERLIGGAIVGKANLTEVKIYNKLEEFMKDRSKHLSDLPEKIPMYGFIIENPIRFEKPIKFKGKLGFFEVNL